MIFQSIIDKAIDIARNKSTGQNAYRHAAILYDKKGNIISLGWNTPKYETPASGMFHRNKKFHAESFCLYKKYGYNRRKGNQRLYLLSVRVDKAGELRNAKPCAECEYLIKLQNIYMVYYSINGGGIENYVVNSGVE